MSKVKISGKANGFTNAPPSKSMAHRLMICSFLAKGGTVHGVSDSADMKATLGCLKALGADITLSDGNAEFNGVKEISGATLPCFESGSTLRFMIPICMLYNLPFTLTGTKRLFSRSLEVYKTLSDERGIEFCQTEDSVFVNGRLTGGKFSVRGDISSQFISGLLFVLPLLSTDSVIEITGKFESAPYVDMTIDALRLFGVTAKRQNNIIEIKGNQAYKPNDVTVEGDWSNSAFFDALNLVGGNVKVGNLNTESLQGDKIYREYFKMIQNGCPELDVSDCPDLAPILMATASACNGAVLLGTKRLAIKESDRGDAMGKELRKFGVRVKARENDITVGCGLKAPTEILYGHNDHRIVMALAVLLTKTGGCIEGYEAVSKSLPDFFERLGELGVDIEYET